MSHDPHQSGNAHGHANADHADPHAHSHVDSWHHHATEEGEPQHEHGGVVNPLAVFIWFVAGIAFLLVTIGVIIMYFDQYATNSRKQHMEAAPARAYWAAYETRRNEMLARVAPQGYELIDAQKATARPPLEVTMRRVIEDYQKRQGAAAAPSPREGPATSTKVPSDDGSRPK